MYFVAEGDEKEDYWNVNKKFSEELIPSFPFAIF
jgi:hypothetical protein